jgi:hypothetical protein
MPQYRQQILILRCVKSQKIADIKSCEPKLTRATTKQIPLLRDLMSRASELSPGVQHPWHQHPHFGTILNHVRPTSILPPCHSSVIAGTLTVRVRFERGFPIHILQVFLISSSLTIRSDLRSVQMHNTTLRNWDFYGANINGNREVAVGWGEWWGLPGRQGDYSKRKKATIAALIKFSIAEPNNRTFHECRNYAYSVSRKSRDLLQFLLLPLHVCYMFRPVRLPSSGMSIQTSCKRKCNKNLKGSLANGSYF